MALIKKSNVNLGFVGSFFFFGFQNKFWVVHTFGLWVSRAFHFWFGLLCFNRFGLWEDGDSAKYAREGDLLTEISENAIIFFT